MTSVVTRTRGILRCGLRPPLRMTKYCTWRQTLFLSSCGDCSPPCHPEEHSDEGSRACAVQQHPPLRGGSVPPKSQSKAGVPHSGVAAMPFHAATASGWKPFCGTMPLRAQRVLKGKGLIRKKGKTAGVPLLVRPPRVAATFPPAMRGHPPHLAGAIPYNDLSVSPLARRSTSPQRGGRVGGAARDARAFPRQKSPPPNHSGVSLSLNPRFHPACRPPALPAAPVARNAGGTPRHTAFFRRGAREPVPPSPALRTLPAASSALLQGVNGY